MWQHVCVWLSEELLGGFPLHLHHFRPPSPPCETRRKIRHITLRRQGATGHGARDDTSSCVIVRLRLGLWGAGLECACGSKLLCRENETRDRSVIKSLLSQVHFCRRSKTS